VDQIRKRVNKSKTNCIKDEFSLSQEFLSDQNFTVNSNEIGVSEFDISPETPIESPEWYSDLETEMSCSSVLTEEECFTIMNDSDLTFNKSPFTNYIANPIKNRVRKFKINRLIKENSVYKELLDNQNFPVASREVSVYSNLSEDDELVERLYRDIDQNLIRRNSISVLDSDSCDSIIPPVITYDDYDDLNLIIPNYDD